MKCDIKAKAEEFAKETKKLEKEILSGDKSPAKRRAYKAVRAISVALKNKDIDKARKLHDEYTSGSDLVSKARINEINSNGPMTEYGKPLIVLSGEIRSDGIMYNVVYPNKSEPQMLSGSKMIASRVDPSQIRGSENKNGNNYSSDDTNTDDEVYYEEDMYDQSQNEYFYEDTVSEEFYEDGSYEDGPMADDFSELKDDIKRDYYNHSPHGKKYYTEIEGSNNFVKSSENMKLFVDDLIAMDNTETTEEEKNFLSGVIDIVAKPLAEYAQDIKVYMDEEAFKNEGEIEFKDGSVGIYLGRGRNSPTWGNDMTLAQRYVHELIHATIFFAIHNGGPKMVGTINRLKKLQAQVMKNITYKDLLPDTSIDAVEEERIAKAQFDYMNSSKFSLEEFMALGMSNKRINDKMKTIDVGRKNNSTKGMNALDKAMEYLKRLIAFAFDRLRHEPKGMKADALIKKLHKELMEANTAAMQGRKENKTLEAIFGKVDDAEEWWQKSMEKISDKSDIFGDVDFKSIPKKNEPFKGVVWMLKNMWALWGNPELRPYFSLVLQHVMLGWANPEGTLQTLLRGFSDTTEFQDKLEELGLARESIDKTRKDVKQATMAIFREIMGRRLTRSEQKSVTMAVLKTDINSLNNKYSASDIKDIFAKDGFLEEKIAEEEKFLADLGTDSGRAEYRRQQIDGLARYLVTGESNRVLQLNAYNIATMAGTQFEKHENAIAVEEIESIDRLVTLKAIQSQSDDVKANMKALANENIQALTAFANTHKQSLRDSSVSEFQEVKGYIKEIFNDEKKSMIAPLKDSEKMLKKGYVLKEKMKTSFAGKKLGLYINNEKLTGTFNISAMGLTDSNKHIGNILTDLDETKDTAKNRKMMKAQLSAFKVTDDLAVKMIMDGKKDMNAEADNMVALKNSKGQVITYVNVLTTAQKAKHLDMEFDPGEIVGSMAGALQDRLETDELNDKLLDVLIADMHENFDEMKDGVEDFEINGESGVKGEDYVLLTAESDIPIVKDVYNIMPRKMKQRIAKLDGGLWVKRSALNDAFGYRDMSIVDVLDKIEQLVGIDLFPKFMKRLIRHIENFLKSVISIFKVDVIMRTPGVLVGNIISNTMYLLQMGGNVKDVFAMQAAGVAELNEYVNSTKRIQRLIAKSVANKGLSDLDQQELDRLQSTLINSTAHELIDAGMYQAIVEDVGMKDIKSSNKIHEYANDKLDKIGAPEWVKTGANWAYMSEKTSAFQIVQRATAYSDFVARYAGYHIGIEKLKKSFKKKNGREITVEELEAGKKEIMKDIRNAFINYNKPDSAFLSYLNDIGLIMFTKWALRIQKVWKDGVAKHPIRFLLAAVGQEIAGIDIDDIADKSVFVHGVGGLLYSPNAVDVATGAIFPMVFRLDDKF